MKSKRNSTRTAPLSARVAGGYTLITGTALMAAWCAYKRRSIRLQDLRAWFACCELVAQRRASGAKSRFCPRAAHVAYMTQVDVSAATAALRRLTAAGLLAFGVHGPDIPETFDDQKPLADDRFLHALTQVRHHARRVPVPRRMLRVLANTARPVFIATVLGHLLRCQFARGGQVASSGLCKASWISAVFEVDVRNVKAARGELIESGWLIVDDAAQRFLNRWGLPVRINLEWTAVPIAAPVHAEHCTDLAELPPRSSHETLESPPPLQNSDRFQRSKNHVPIPDGGLCDQVSPETVRPFRDVQPTDLRSPTQLQALFRGALQAGLVQACAADELRFFAAAERAISLGKTNPAGFFATLVRRGWWHVISQRDEDAARRRLSPNTSELIARGQSAPCRADTVLPNLLHALRGRAGAPAGLEKPNRGQAGDAGFNPPRLCRRGATRGGTNPLHDLAPRRRAEPSERGMD